MNGNLKQGETMHHHGEGCAHCGHHHDLVIEDLMVRYRHVDALDGVNYSTSCGTCVGLLGPNGAGKSTLLKAIAGLLPISRGRISWRGAKVAKWSREIAYLPQRENVDWNFPITVRKVVEMGRYPQVGWWKPFRKEDREVVERSLSMMSLDEIADRQISQLSGGQQQRVFLARSLAQEAHVLLLDEPFTGLDRPSKESLAVLLGDLAKEGRLVIASHHDLTNVREIYDEVLMLNKRSIVSGKVEEVFHAEAIERVYGND